ALSNRFRYGFTAELPAQGVPLVGTTATSTTSYPNIVAPIDGYIFVYLSTSTDTEADYSNIYFEKVLVGTDIAQKDDLERIIPEPINRFLESSLVALSANGPLTF